MVSPALINERRQNQTRRLLVKEVMSGRHGKIEQPAALDLDAVTDELGIRRLSVIREGR